MPLDKDQREKITAFFEELMLEHGGAFTLFGIKPVTIEELIETSKDTCEEMQEFLKQHPEIEFVLVDRKLEEGWEEWKKLISKPKCRNYILTEISFENHNLLVFVNIKTTALTMKKHYNEFKRVFGQDFNPHKMIAELKEGKDELWRKILLDHITKGILFGYGAKNASLFNQRMHNQKKLGLTRPSENNDPREKAECLLNQKPFRIPIFVMLDEKESKVKVETYKKEREEIKSLYLGKDFLKVTLDKLHH